MRSRGLLSTSVRRATWRYNLNSAAGCYDLCKQFFGRQLGHRPDFLRSQFGQSLRCQFGR